MQVFNQTHVCVGYQKNAEMWNAEYCEVPDFFMTYHLIKASIVSTLYRDRLAHSLSQSCDRVASTPGSSPHHIW
jgi:hypothetical protein